MTISLSQSEKSALAAEIEEMRRQMSEPANPEKAMAMVSRILIAYPSAQMTEAKAAAMSEAYLDSLSDMPLWAIEGARKRWNRGDVADIGPANLSFAPSAPQLRMLALSERERATYRLYWLETILRKSEEQPADAQPKQKRDLSPQIKELLDKLGSGTALPEMPKGD